MKISSALLVLTVSVVATTGAQAQSHFTVGADSTIDMGDAVITMDCSDLRIHGTAHLSTAQVFGINDLQITGALTSASTKLSMAGDLNTIGSSNFGTGTVSIVDGCTRAQSTIAGSPSLYNLTVASNTGKKLVFESGKTTTVTGQLSLQGTSAKPLTIRSSTPDTPALLSATTQQTIQFENVADNRAVGAVIAPDAPESFHSSAAGNVFRWFLFDDNGLLPQPPQPTPSVVPVPALSSLMALLMTMLLGFIGFRALSRPSNDTKI